MGALFDALPLQVNHVRQITCVNRELGKRRHVYPRLVQSQRITQAKADEEIAAMEAVLESVKLAEQAQELVQLAETIAAFRPGGVDQDDDSDTINSLRTRARAILKKMGRQ